MLDGTAADRHRIWYRFEPTLHLIEHRFVLPLSDALLFTRDEIASVLKEVTGSDPWSTNPLVG